MAAGRKEYELQMKLTAAIGSSFGSSFQSAMSTTKKLQSTLQNLKKVQGNVSAYKKTQEAINATKAKVQEYESKHNALQSELAQTVAKEKELQKALKESENSTGTKTKEYKQLQKQLQSTRNEGSKLRSQIKDNERATASANEKIKEQEQRLSDLSQQLKATGTNTDKLAQETQKLEKAYQRVQKAQEDYARVNSAIEKNKSAISATKSELVKTVGIVGTAGEAFYKGFITPAANLQAQMSTVKAISGATGEEMEQLNALAKKMGATTKFTAVEAGQALEYMAMAGWKTNNMLSGLPGIMNLAAASGEELAIVSDIVTDAMTAFGLSADGTTKGISNVNYFTDILAATAANSNTNVALLGESFKFAAPLAGSFGFSVEDTALALGLMANSGIKASQSGTSLRKIFTALSSEVKIAQKDGSNFVVATQNADGTMRDLKSIIDDVRTAFNGMTDSDIIAMQNDLSATAQSLGIALNDENGDLKTQAALYADVQDAIQNMTDAGKIQEAEAIASKTAMAGLLSIVNASSSDYTRLADAIYNANGAAEKMAETRLDNLNGDITLAKSAWDGLATTIGEMFLPNLRTAVQGVTEFLNKANEFAQANPELIKQLVAVAGGLGALKVGSLAGKLGFLEMKGGVLEVIKSFVGFRADLAEGAAEAVTGGGKFAALGKSITGYFSKVKSSVGGVGTAISKLAGGPQITIFSKVGETMKSGLLKPLGDVKDRFGKISGTVSGSVKSVFLKPLGNIDGKVKDRFGKINGTVSGSVKSVFDKISSGPLGKIGGVFGNLGKSIGTVLGGPLKSLGSLFSGLFGKAMPIVAIISALSILFLKLSGEDISGFLAPFKDALDKLKPVLTDAMNQFKDLGKQIMPLLMNAAKQLAPLLGQIVTAILPVILQLIQLLVPLICQLVQDLLPIILNIITSLAPLITQIITAVLPIAVTLLQTLLPVITQIVSSVLPVVSEVLSAILPLINELIQLALPLLTSLLETLMPIIQVLADLFSGVLGTAIQALMPIIEALLGVLTGVINFVVGVFTGDWGKAWEGVKGIFENIINALIGIFKLPINGIIDLINLFIGGLNKLKVPDWVPGVGGKSINIPLIPKLEKGSNFTPDTFIAGDVNGKGGELITGARGRKVFTAAQTTTILDNINKAKAINDSAKANAPRTGTVIERVGGFIGAVKSAAAEQFGGESTKSEISAKSTPSGETKIEIHYAPTIYVQGDKPEELEEKLKQNNEKLLQMFKEFLRQERENERRMSYA